MDKPDYNTRRINTTEIFRHYSEKEIERLIAEDLERRSGVVGKPSHRKVLLSTKEVGSSGPQHYAEVTLTVDHGPLLFPAGK